MYTRALIGAFGLDFRGLRGPTDWSAEGGCVRRMFVTAFRYHSREREGSQGFTVKVERASGLHAARLNTRRRAIKSRSVRAHSQPAFMGIITPRGLGGE